MVVVQIVHIHEFVSVEEGFDMLLSVEFVAEDFHRALVLNLSKYAWFQSHIEVGGPELLTF